MARCVSKGAVVEVVATGEKAAISNELGTVEQQLYKRVVHETATKHGRRSRVEGEWGTE